MLLPIHGRKAHQRASLGRLRGSRGGGCRHRDLSDEPWCPVDRGRSGRPGDGAVRVGDEGDGNREDGQSTERGGEKQELKGKKGDLDVTIELEQETPTTTKVEVTARENMVEWDKDYAEQILRRIVEKG
jgi:hypothetical protein